MSLADLAKKLFGVEDISTLTNEQLEEISQEMKLEQVERWGEAREFGLTEEDPTKQAARDEKEYPISPQGESKG